MTTQAGSLYLMRKIDSTKSINGARRMSLLKKEEGKKRGKKQKRKEKGDAFIQKTFLF